MAECVRCKEVKSQEEFYKDSRAKSGLDSYCKTCRSGMCQKYYQKNRKKIIEHNSKRKHTNEYWQEYRSKNRDTLREYHRRYEKNRKEVDVNFRISCNLRRRLNHAIRGTVKSGSSVKDLGCSVEELKQYLESRFQLDMTWDNYGEWHIDHIKPLSLFDLTDRKQFLEAVHYTNLQPLWAKDNMRKYNNG